MSATIRQVVDDALTVAGEVSGAGVQAFSEDRMFDDVVRAFNMLFKKYPWGQFSLWTTHTLDGVTGVSTTAMNRLKDVEDIYAIHIAGSPKPLPMLPNGYNPFVLTGTVPMYWSASSSDDAAFETKKYRVWPITSTGQVNIHMRVYPRDYNEEWDWNDVMYLDRDMLVHATAYLTLLADETNAAAADGQRLLMEARFSDIKAGFADKPIAAGGSTSNIPMEWFPR